MAKDILDKDTHDAFVSFEQLERETFIGNALATGGHYQAVKPNQYYKVSGNRYAGSTTPDVVRDMWSTPQEIVEWMESEFGEYDLDAAASQENAVCEKFYSKETNCLKRWWGSNKHVWLNPPYSNQLHLSRKQLSKWSTTTKLMFCCQPTTLQHGFMRRRKTRLKSSGSLARFTKRVE